MLHSRDVQFNENERPKSANKEHRCRYWLSHCVRYCVAVSTDESEYMALSSAAQEAVWLRQLTTELGNPPPTSTTIFEDNQSAISMTKNPQFHGRASFHL